MDPGYECSLEPSTNHASFVYNLKCLKIICVCVRALLQNHRGSIEILVLELKENERKFTSNTLANQLLILGLIKDMQ